MALGALVPTTRPPVIPRPTTAGHHRRGGIHPLARPAHGSTVMSIHFSSVHNYLSPCDFSAKFNGLRFPIIQKLKICKTIRQHLSRKYRKLEILGKDQSSDHMEMHVPSEKSVSENLSNDPIAKTAPMNSSIEEDNNALLDPPPSLLDAHSYDYHHNVASTSSLCIAVVGATGELARNKVFPALFALYYSGFLPEDVGIFGYSRKQLTDEDLRRIIEGTLTCRVDHREKCEDKLYNFLTRTYHINGGFDNKKGMRKLDSLMRQTEVGGEANRIFYLSVPQEALLDVASCIADHAQSTRGWNRIIIEKPFGLNAVSSHKMNQYLLSKFKEKQIYRIDHLLGKDLIENLTVLRFSNLVFEPLWSRTYIRNVQVILSEDAAIETRGRYSDGYGIIQDIVHSHILQTIALFAMEPPVSLDGEDIRNEKVKVLRSIRKLELSDIVLGQHKSSSSGKINEYLSTLTPTFFAAALYIDNARWDGVPFLIKTGMGLIKHRVEIRIQFHNVPGNLYRERIGHNIALATNELILRDAPVEAIFLRVNNKVPGLGLQLDASELNLLYRDKYDIEMPDSYEHLLLDVIDGDNHLFLRSDELESAWEVLTPVLHEIDEHKITPELYEYGGRGPVGAYYLGAKHGVRWADD